MNCKMNKPGLHVYEIKQFHNSSIWRRILSLIKYEKLNKITTMYEYLDGLNTLIEGSKDGKKNKNKNKNNCT